MARSSIRRVVAAFIDVAEDLRRQKENGAVGAALPRNRRLVALLAALIIGTTSAVAGVPELRDAFKSIFGSGAAPSPAPATPVPAALNPDATFGFGPLGDTLSIAPTASRTRGERTVVPRSRAVRAAAARWARATGRAAPSNAFRAPGGGTEKLTHRARKPKGTPAPDGATTTTQGPAPDPDGGCRAGPELGGRTGGGSDKSGVRAEDKGRGLGKSMPTPRPPAQQPSQNRPPEGGRPDPPGRTDPPAIGRDTGPAAPNAQAGDHQGGPQGP